MSAKERFLGGLRKLQLKAQSLLAGPVSHVSISAMIRVKNEEAFLFPAVQSIIDHVDELVLIDNQSTDGTRAVIERLRFEYPEKITAYDYPYEVRRVGRENHELATARSARSSPHLLANYYNWCLRKCTRSYVLKWDGDMVATERFAEALAEFRHSGKRVLRFRGANLHPDLEHLIQPSGASVAELQGQVMAPTSLSNWMAPHTDLEPRLFPRAGAHYYRGFWWCERLQGPFLEPRYEYHVEAPTYLHLKYCKDNPYENFSDDFQSVIAANIGRGPKLTPDLMRAVQQWDCERRSGNLNHARTQG